jgi:hypothetical protein
MVGSGHLSLLGEGRLRWPPFYLVANPRNTHLGTEGPLKSTALAPEEAHLTDEQWALLLPLLPPQEGGIGRPPNDHRVVLSGILWVARTGSSWREMPEEYGKWERAYRRYELWVKQGLWPRILRVLGEEDVPGPEMKEPK